MQIVIDIPEDVYKDIQSHDWKNGGRWFSEEWKAIHNGTPLPKKHGRLIDADRANNVARETRTDRDERIIRNFLTGLPTIIEADGGDAE